MQVILTLLGSIFAKVFADKVVGWIALKTILVFLFITVVPLLLNNFTYDLINIVVNFASQQSSGASAFSSSMTFTDFTGWLLDCFQISAAISVLISALSLRVVLSMIPFVRLVG